MFEVWLLLGSNAIALGQGLEQQAAWQVKVCVWGWEWGLPFPSYHRAPSHGTNSKHGGGGGGLVCRPPWECN